MFLFICLSLNTNFEITGRKLLTKLFMCLLVVVILLKLVVLSVHRSNLLMMNQNA